MPKVFITASQAAAAKYRHKDVHVPELAPPGVAPEDCYMRVCEMSGADRGEWDLENYQRRKENDQAGIMDQLSQRLLSRCIRDENDKLMYPGPKGMEAIGKLPGPTVEKLTKAAYEINALNQAEVAKAGKDSPTDPS